MVTTASDSPIVEVVAPRPELVASDVQTFVNGHRRQVGAPAIALQWQLNQSAQAHAVEMARNRRMTHTGSGGTSAGTRLSRTGYRWWLWGENVAAGQTTASQVVYSWLRSPGHKAVMLDRRYRHMGVGRAVASNGVVYWCLVMAAPK